MNCPSCARQMEALSFESHTGRPLELDLCAGCHVLWFDRHESLRLAPGATLKVFSLIGERSGNREQLLADVLRCPRCPARLRLTHDRQRNTTFRYWSCHRGHGRLITFFDFLREKNFIRVLSPAQLSELRQHVQSVNCSNCGAPIDLEKRSSCAHCGAPLSMLDMTQAGQLVAQLRDAAAPKPIDPALPMELARARREVDAAFASMQGGSDWWRDASSLGVVEAGLAVVGRWLKRGR